MKINSNLFTRICRITWLGLFSLTLLAANSPASEIRMYVRAYGKQWARVIPGSNTGGRVLWNSTSGYFTDRANRGEWYRIEFHATRVGEYGIKSGDYSTCGWSSGPVTSLPEYLEATVPVDPNCDNQHFWISTNFGMNDVRLPIGGRP